MRALNKSERKALVSQQNGCCPCCKNPLPSGLGQQAAYDAQKNTVICRKCAVVVFNLRHVQPCTVEYMASQIQPSPKSEAQRAVETGRVLNPNTGKPYASWEEALGEHPEWAYSGGRTIDKDGNIYDRSGTVVGNTEEGRL